MGNNDSGSTATVRIVEPWLNGCAKNIYSQYGEDGLLEAIFKHIGTTNRWCFEVGAHDGQMLSNVAHLIEQGWSAVLVEQGEELHAACVARYAARPDVRCVHEYVFPWKFEALLESVGLPNEPDLGVIDIDEQDFWLWAGMQRIRPRVMVVEFGYGRPVDQIPPLIDHTREPVPWIQAGHNMIHFLGRAKGYFPVAITEANMIFVRNELLD